MNPSPAKAPPLMCIHQNTSRTSSIPISRLANNALHFLAAAGFDVSAKKTFDWIHDTFLILIRIFPGDCPPTTHHLLQHTLGPTFLRCSWSSSASIARGQRDVICRQRRCYPQPLPQSLRLNALVLGLSRTVRAAGRVGDVVPAGNGGRYEEGFVWATNWLRIRAQT
jgi:hypothetical protein